MKPGRWITVKRVSKMEIWMEDSKIEKIRKNPIEFRPELHAILSDYGRYTALHQFELIDRCTGLTMVEDDNTPKR